MAWNNCHSLLTIMHSPVKKLPINKSFMINISKIESKPAIKMLRLETAMKLKEILRYFWASVNVLFWSERFL